MLYYSEYYGIQSIDVSITHHGILGQRWGKRNGPPYPLGPSDHSSREKKAGWRKSLSKTSTASKSKRKGLTDRQKRAIKIGTGIAVAGLAAYGGYKLYKSGALGTPISKLPGDSGSSEVLIKDDLGIPLIKEDMADHDHLVVSNPTHDQHNCKQVSIAVAERIANKRDVVAKLKSFSGNLHDIIGRYYEEGEKAVGSIDCDGSNAQTRLEKQLLRRYKDGDVGAVNFDIGPKYRNPLATEAGHCFNWKIENGRVKYMDGQGDSDGNLIDPTRFFKYKDPSTELEYVRITGLHLKKELYKEILENRKSQ